MGITADTKPLERNLKRGVRRVDEFERSFRKLTLAANKVYQPVARVTKSVVSLRGAMTALASAGIIGTGIKRLSDYGAEVQHMADRLDIGVEQLQRWRLEVEGTGATQKHLNTSLTAFNRRRAEALAGNKPYLKIFEQLNIQLRDSVGNYRENQVVLEEFMAAVRRIPDAGEQFRVLQALFSEAGRPLRDWIANNEAATAAVADLRVNTEAELRAVTDLNQGFSNTGAVIRTEFLSGLAQATGRIEDMQMRIQQLATQHAPQLISALIGIGDATFTVASHWKAFVAVLAGTQFVALTQRVKGFTDVVAGFSAVRQATLAQGPIAAAQLKQALTLQRVLGDGASAGLIVGIDKYRSQVRAADAATKVWGNSVATYLTPALLGIGTAALAALVLYRKELKGLISDLREATGGENAPAKTLVETLSFGAGAGVPAGNLALERARKEYKEVFTERANAEKQLESLRRRGYQEGSVDVLKYEKIVRESTDRLAVLWKRQAAIIANASQQASTQPATATAPATPLAIQSVEPRTTASATKLLDMQKSSLRAQAEALADNLVTAQQFTRELKTQDTFADRFLAKQRQLESLTNQINDATLRRDTLEAHGQSGLAAAEQATIDNLKQQRTLISGIQVQLDTVSTTATNMPPVLGDPVLMQRSLDLMMSVVPAIEEFQTRGQRAGEALASSFSGFDTQIKSIITNTDSWGDALERIGRLLIYTGVTAFTRPGGVLESLFPGRAIGGHMYAGSGYMAGERGPELIVPSTDSTAIPMTKMGGGVTVYAQPAVYVQGPVDAATVTRIGDEVWGRVISGLGSRRVNRELAQRNGAAVG